MLNKGLFKAVIIFCFALVLSACGNDKPTLTPLSQNATVLAFGDSLTFGSGSNSATESYPAVLAQLTGLTVINKGIPGEVSQHGLERLAEVLQQTKPELVLLCHGGNDIIRKLGKQQLKSNLEQMVTLIKNSGAQVVLIAVPNFSLMLNVPELYPEVAEAYAVPIEMNIMPKLERSPKLKSDQIHPNAAGYRLMAQSVQQLLIESGAL
jgi:lysophospholipase L1-like esterase